MYLNVVTWIKRTTGARLLLVIAGIFALVGATISSAMVAADYRNTLAEANQRNVVLVQLLEEHTRLAFEVSKLALIDVSAELVVSGQPVMTPGLAAAIQRWVEESRVISAIWVINPDGSCAYNSLGADPSGFTFADREYFKALRGGDDFYVGRMMLTRLDKQWVFSLSKRLVNKRGEFLGVLIAANRVDYFDALYARLGIGPSDNIVIVKPDGSVVARRLFNWVPEGDLGPSLATHPLITTYAPQSSSGIFGAVSTIDHIERLGAYRVVEGWPLIVASGLDKQQVLAPWRNRTINILAYYATGVVTLGFLTWWGYLRIAGEAGALALATSTAARNTVLLNEVHHRVRNNLAIIQSLLMLEANRVPAEAQKGYQDSISRVEAMGLVHCLLYQTQDFEGVDAGDYIQRLCDGLQASAPPGIRLKTDLESVPVDLDTAVPMALIINELVTNALKHAFPDGRQGKVTIRLRRDGYQAVLTVTDNGIGLPGQGDHNSRTPQLGLMLVKQLTRQVNGTIRFQDGDGTVAILTFPLCEPGPH